jgi:amidase
MAWLASGSDLGGSLRNPASFCGIVGFRPSIGRIPTNPGDMAFYRLSVEGPMARTVGDVAMLLDVMAGRDPRDPLSVTRPEQRFEAMAEARTVPKRVAFSPDLGVTPVDPEIASICRRAAQRFEDMGATVEENHPDFSDLQHVFHTFRALGFAARHGSQLDKQRSVLKPEIVWNVEKGLSLTGEEIARAMRARAAIYARAQVFFQDYDLLISPATIVPPFPVEQRYVERLGEHEFSNYIEWCSIAYAITVIGAPAVSIPCGFTSAGLPVGLQIAAAPLNEGPLLSAALLFEEAVDLTSGLPIDPVTAH